MKRINYLSLASVLASFAVVLLHMNGVFWNFSKEKYWLTANVIESVMYFAVPVFFMISGATLLDYRDRYTTKEYAVKRINKTVIPFLFWSAIGVIYLALTGQGEFELSVVGILKAFHNILNINVLSIYWFFGALFSVYLCIPLISCIPKAVRIKIFAYIVIVSFIFNSLIPFVCSVFSIPYVQNVTIPIANGYIFYVLLGYILHNVEILRVQRWVLYILAIVGLLLHMVGTYYLSYEANGVVQTYKGYLNVPCILYSIGIFVAIKEIGELIQSKKIIKIINTIGSYTFAIYLLHWFVINAGVIILNVDLLSTTYRIGGSFIVYFICIIITCIIRKIPYLNKVLP